MPTGLRGTTVPCYPARASPDTAPCRPSALPLSPWSRDQRRPFAPGRNRSRHEQHRCHEGRTCSPSLRYSTLCTELCPQQPGGCRTRCGRKGRRRRPKPRGCPISARGARRGGAGPGGKARLGDAAWRRHFVRPFCAGRPCGARCSSQPGPRRHRSVITQRGGQPAGQAGPGRCVPAYGPPRAGRAAQTPRALSEGCSAVTSRRLC